MILRLKHWTAAGACLLAAGAVPEAAARPGASLAASVWAASEGGESGEGGEGGEGGGVRPAQYRLLLDPARDPHYDGATLARHYAHDVRRGYREAHAAALSLLQSLRRLLDSPSDASLSAAREAWRQARRPYLATEVFRFYDGPIDAPATEARAAGPEGRLNAWPLNEAVIDYVDGQPEAGLVHDPAIEMTTGSILARDQVSDEADVTTGWHAIEFLLWGQDRDANGPGARPASDFVAGSSANDRRRAYLALLAQQVVDDLAWLEAQWNPDSEGSYAVEFLALQPHEAIGRMLTGAALLAGHELASERLAVALDSGSQEDEQSCFSDSTWQDFVWDLAGIKRVYYGRGASASIATTLQRLQPGLALEMERRFAEAERRVAALHDPFDRILTSAPDSRERADAEAAVLALQQLAAGLRDTGRALGVLVIVPGV
jgi:putative iron-regulated protein